MIDGATGFAAAEGAPVARPEHFLLALAWEPHGRHSQLLGDLAVTSARLQAALPLDGMSRVAIGMAAAAMATVSGTRMTTDQVRSAEEIWLTRSLAAGSEPACSAERARIGTIALVSAPPRTSS